MADDLLKLKITRARKGWLVDRIGLLIERFNHVLRIDQMASLRELSIHRLEQLAEGIVRAESWVEANLALSSAIAEAEVSGEN